MGLSAPSQLTRLQIAAYVSDDIGEPTGKLHTLHLQVVKDGVARTMHILSAIVMGVPGCTTCTTNKKLEYSAVYVRVTHCAAGKQQVAMAQEGQGRRGQAPQLA